MAPTPKFAINQRTWPLVKRLVRGYVRPQAWRLFLAVICMALTAAASGGLAKMMEPVLDEVFIAKRAEALPWVAAGVLAVFMVKGAAAYGQSVLMSYVGQRIIANVQSEMFAHLMRADLAYFQRHASGKLIARFINDANMMRAAVANALTGMGKDTLTVLFLIGIMFHQDWQLGLITFVIFPVAVIPIVKIGRRMRKVATTTQEETGAFTTLLDETFKGARVVKAYGMEDYESGRARKAADTLFRLMVRSARVRSASHPIMETLGGVSLVLVIGYGGFAVIDGTMTTGKLFSFITALLLAYEPMKKLAQLNANLQEGLAATARVFEMLDVEPDITDRPGAKPYHPAGGAIRFEHVVFSYDERVQALNGLDLDVPAGGTVALVGPSGAGKSTVLNLIPRFYDVKEGRVSIDGADVRDLTMASLRRQIALVSQEISLFDDTVRANISYGRPDASEDEIIAAAKAADAHKFISALPDGYDTHVGGRGLKLSGGQRQKLSIARAMLKDAPILLLDEATSALDTESERQVQGALDRLMQGRTTLVIAHRLSTIANADLIYVIDHGKAVESGTHAALMARGGAYARLYTLQFAPAGETKPTDSENAAAARAVSGA